MVQPPGLAAAAAIGVVLAISPPAGAFPNLFSRPATSKPPVSAPASPATTASDVPADPAVRLGALPDGLRYAIIKTASAPGKASLRLRLNVGSLMEGPGEQGFAQLLARAPFDGTRPSPGGPMSEVAKAHGLTFDADDSADAEAEATTFSLDLAATDPATLDTALALLRGAAGEPRLAQPDIDREWATVIAHDHASNDLANRLFKARLGFLLEGQGPAGLLAARTAGLPPRVKRGAIADFHGRFYRPERAFLVVAGDIDAGAVEAAIRARFEGWRGIGQPGADRAPGPVEQRGSQARLMVEAGAPASLQLSWVAPPDSAPDSATRRRREAIQRLALSVLNRRLAALADSANPPFVSAAAFQDNLYGAARVTSLLVNADPDHWPDHWREALATIDQAQRAVIAFGVAADELPGARAAAEADLAEAAASADSRSPATIADTVAANLAAGETVTTPAQDLALFDAATAGVSADQVLAVLKETFSGQGPLLFMSSPSAIDGGEPLVAGVFADIHARPAAPAVAPAPSPSAWREFGEPGKIAERRDAIDLDTVFVRFENGVRLTLKPTKLKEGEISVKVRVGGGLEALPADRTAPIWALPALVEGAPVKIAMDAEALTLSGAVGRDDLDTLLRTLANPIVAPAWRQDAFERVQKAAAARIAQDDRTAAGALALALPGLAHGGDRRWAAPDALAVTAATLGDARRSIDALLADGSIEVVVVGDVTEDKATDAVAATFGALPARPAPPTPVPALAPSLALNVLSHHGAGEDALAAVIWPTGDVPRDPREAGVVEVLTEVLRARVAASGAQPQALSGFAGVALQGPPAQLDGLLARDASLAADLRARDIGGDELARAKTILQQSEDSARRANAHWLDLLSGAQGDPRRVTAIRAYSAAIERVRPADVRAAAQRYLRTDAAVKIEVKPAGS